MKHADLGFNKELVITLERYGWERLPEMRQVFKENLFQTYIRESIVYKESQQQGIPVLDHKPESKATADHMNLAQEILNKFDHLTASAEPQAQTQVQSTARVKDFSINAGNSNNITLKSISNSFLCCFSLIK